MAEKPIKGDKDKKDARDDESDEERTEDWELLLGDPRNKPEKKKPTAEKSKASTSKGKMKAEPPTSGERESARIPILSTTGRRVMTYEVDSAHKHFYEGRSLEEGYESASDPEDPANTERSQSVETFVPTDGDPKNEDIPPSRHITGVLTEISKGKSTVMEMIPLAQVAQRGVQGAGIGHLVVSQGLMAAAVSAPYVPGARLAGEVEISTDATGGTIPENIAGESTDDKAKPCKEASPAKKAKAETSSPAKKKKAETSSPAKKKKEETSSPAKKKKEETSSPAKKEETSSPAKKKKEETSSPSKKTKAETSSPSKKTKAETSSSAKAETSSPAKKAKWEITPRKHVSRFLERLSPGYRKLESSSSDSSISSPQIPFSDLRLQGADSPSEMSEQSSSKDDEKVLSSSEEEEKSPRSSSKKREEGGDSTE